MSNTIALQKILEAMETDSLLVGCSLSRCAGLDEMFVQLRPEAAQSEIYIGSRVRLDFIAGKQN